MKKFFIEQNFSEQNPVDLMLSQEPIIEDPEYKDCTAKFKIGEREYHIKKHAFKRFKERAEFERDEKQLLEDFYRLLNSSIKVERKTGLRMFFKYKSQETQYRQAGNWIFVITNKKFLSTCYKEKDFV